MREFLVVWEVTSEDLWIYGGSGAAQHTRLWPDREQRMRRSRLLLFSVVIWGEHRLMESSQIDLMMLNDTNCS